MKIYEKKFNKMRIKYYLLNFVMIGKKHTMYNMVNLHVRLAFFFKKSLLFGICDIYYIF